MKNPAKQVKKETSVLVGVIMPEQTEVQVTEYLNELAFLVDTAGATVVKKFIQRIESPHPATFIGSGKLEEIANYIKEKGVDMVVFDDELQANQLRNIEKEVNCKVLDRTNLILDIFAKRARTAHARTQVELAQYEYLLPRLVGMWKHLERQRGGIGLRGPGERELETDRRIVRERISLLKKELAHIDRQMATRRKSRSAFVRISLVGYTNVGKSTLMNLLSKSNVFAENKLFATLDTTVRKVVIGNLPFLLSDTVGFIRKLPPQLVESFKSTLDEIRESDILLHVIDISHPHFEEQIKVVNQTLMELDCLNKPIINVFNKTDLYLSVPEQKEKQWTIHDLERSWIGRSYSPCIFISATRKINIEKLRRLLYEKAREIHVTRYPYDNFLYPDLPDEENFSS